MTVQEAFAQKKYPNHRVSWELVNYAMKVPGSAIVEIPKKQPPCDGSGKRNSSATN